MKIDLHLHIKRNSRCAKMEIPDAVQTLTNHNITGFSLFDHYYFTKDKDIQQIKDINPLLTVFKGTEINIRGQKGKNEDFVIISDVEPPTSTMTKREFILSDFLIYLKDNPDTIVILAHPFRRHDFVDFDFSFPLDCIEIRSTHINDINKDKILDFAFQHGIGLIVNSDAHKIGHIGEYFTEIPDGITTCSELKCCLETKRYKI